MCIQSREKEAAKSQALEMSQTVRHGMLAAVSSVHSEPQLQPHGAIGRLRSTSLGPVSCWLPFSPSSSRQGLQRDTLPAGKG